jgi:hypothetical protein
VGEKYQRWFRLVTITRSVAFCVVCFSLSAVGSLARAHEPMDSTIEIPSSLIANFHIDAIELDIVFRQHWPSTSQTFSRTKIQDNRTQVEIVHGGSYDLRNRDPVWSILSIYEKHYTQYWKWRRVFEQHGVISDGIKRYRNCRPLDVLGISCASPPELVGTLPKPEEMKVISIPMAGRVVFSSDDGKHRLFCELASDASTIQPLGRVAYAIDSNTTTRYWRFSNPEQYKSLLLPKRIDLYSSESPLPADKEWELVQGTVTPFSPIETIELSNIAFDDKVTSIKDPIVDPGTMILDSRSVPVSLYPGGNELIGVWATIVAIHAKNPIGPYTLWITGLSVGIVCLSLVLATWQSRQAKTSSSL